MSGRIPWTNPGGPSCCCITCGSRPGAVGSEVELQYEDFASIYNGGTFTIEATYQASIGGSVTPYGGAASLSGSAKHRGIVSIITPSANPCIPQRTLSTETVFDTFTSQWSRPTASPDGTEPIRGWFTTAEGFLLPEPPVESQASLQSFLTLDNSSGKNLMKFALDFGIAVQGGNLFYWNFTFGESASHVMGIQINIATYNVAPNTTMLFVCPNNTYALPAYIRTVWARQTGVINGSAEQFIDSPLIVLDPPPILTYTPSAP